MLTLCCDSVAIFVDAVVIAVVVTVVFVEEEEVTVVFVPVDFVDEEVTVDAFVVTVAFMVEEVTVLSPDTVMGASVSIRASTSVMGCGEAVDTIMSSKNPAKAVVGMFVDAEASVEFGIDTFVAIPVVKASAVLF